ncbi:hypothetical protein AB7X74_15605, partial [Escherichia coli]
FCGACGNNRTNRGGFQFAAARLPWFIKDRIAAKDYVDITMAATPESKSSGVNAVTKAATTIEMLDCKIYSDAIDFSTEDVTAAVRPSLRIVYNWIDWD